MILGVPLLKHFSVCIFTLSFLIFQIHENGTVKNPHDFYFNLREASKGSTKELLLQRVSKEASEKRFFNILFIEKFTLQWQLVSQ